MWYQNPMARDRGDRDARRARRTQRRRAVTSTDAAEALRGCAEVVFERDGINCVGCRNVRRVSSAEKELSVCRRGRV
jgi:hypothetical protein